MIYREKDFGPTLCHINPNHDPRNGQFASGHGSIGGASQKPTKKSSKIMSESTKKKIKTGAGMALGASMMLPAASLNNRIFKGGSVVLGEYMLSAVLAVAGGLTMRAVMESSKNPKK